jgi:hypothetical protein
MTASDLPWCVIGAGPSGLAAVKNLLEAGIAAECLEREDDVGGNWYFGSGTSRVFASTRLISSQRLTEFLDHPMPRELPAYPDHRQCLAYLRDYARRFGLAAHIRTGMCVESVVPRGAPGSWVQMLADATAKLPFALIVADMHAPGARLVCVNADTGEEKWREEILWDMPVKGQRYKMSILRASLLQVDGKILCLGETGSLHWDQEEPDQLHLRADGAPYRLLRRGEAYLCEAARQASRTKAGNPEGYFGAFANVYADAAEVICARRDGRAPGPHAHSFASARDGVLAMRFIEAAVDSSRRGGAWVDARLPSH